MGLLGVTGGYKRLQGVKTSDRGIKGVTGGDKGLQGVTRGYMVTRLVCHIKRRKSFFHNLFSRSMTWEYRGLQGVTRG